MKIFLACMIVTAVQSSCIVNPPEPSQLMTSFIVANVIVESNSSSRREFRRLMSLKVEDFKFPILLGSPVFTFETFDKIRGTGFCGSEEDTSQVILTVKETTQLDFVFYGCNLHTGKDIKIIVTDEKTYRLGATKNRGEVIDIEYSYSFCICEAMTDQIKKCFNKANLDEVFRNNTIVLVMTMAGIAFLVILTWFYQTFVED